MNWTFRRLGRHIQIACAADDCIRHLQFGFRSLRKLFSRRGRGSASMVLIAAAILGGSRVPMASEPRDVQREKSAERGNRFIGPFIRPPRADEIPSLINLLEHDHSRVRCEAAAALYAAGPQAAAALPALLKSARDPDAQVRLFVAAALASVALRDRRIVPTLIQLLRDESKRVQEAAVDALGEIGPAGKAAVPMLVDVVIEDYDRVDEYGTRASLAIATLGAFPN